MAELLQLDKAAALVGKSEVTLRRLVKAGKIPFQKEKTLTGFIYLVDPDKVRRFYNSKDGEVFTEEPVQAAEPARTAAGVRVAVASESGGADEYWQKKAGLYEDRYYEEVGKHAQTREELGVWRGRAEQSQAMLIKLLPAPPEVEVRQGEAVPVRHPDKNGESGGLLLTIAVSALTIIVCLAIGAVVYLKFLA